MSVPVALFGLFVIENNRVRIAFGALSIAAWIFSSYWIWSKERQRAVLAGRDHTTTEAQLIEVTTPRLSFVLQDDCCRKPTLASIGVANLTSTSVEDASVYINIPALGIQNRLLEWAGEGGRPINIHHGPVSQHHHTDWIFVLGDNGEYILHPLAYRRKVDPGTYIAEIVVKGRNAEAATARVQFDCLYPRRFGVQLLPPDASA